MGDLVTRPVAPSSSHVFLAFNEQVEVCRAWLRSQIADACGHSAQVLLDRLTQRVAELGLAPYAMAVHARLQTSPDVGIPLPATALDCGKGSMHLGSGRITVTLRQLFANLIEFLVHWTIALAAILAGALTRRRALPAVLVVDLADENLFVDDSDEQFVRYCRCGPIHPLRVGRQFFVISSSGKVSSDPEVFTYCPRPLLALVRRSPLGFVGRLELLLRHFALLFAYHLAVFRMPPLSLLGTDAAYSSISLGLDKRALIESIVLTCSSYRSQPLWTRSLRHARVHMVWYAQNWKPIAYGADDVDADFPWLRWIRVDTHWVWTRAFADYLKTIGLGDSEMKAVGPILLRLPEISARASTPIKVAVFDVPAVSDRVMLELNGEITNYLNPANVQSFIDDVLSLKPQLEAAFGSPVLLSLKMKRGFRPDYSQEYYEHVDALNADGLVSLVDPQMNLYSLISGSHLVIAYPFTSPAYVGESLGVASIYYDPTASIVEHNFCDSHTAVHFASGREALLATAVALLKPVAGSCSV